MVTIAISADRGIPKNQLDQLAIQTALPLLDQHIQADYLLHITTDYLELRKIEHIQRQNKKHKQTKSEAIHVDFVAGKTNHRRLHGGGKGQDIAKAIGFHKIDKPTILDLTAGMGGDSFVLATLGATVTLIERNVITHALLNDALNRAALTADADLQSIIQRMSLINKDANDVLDSLAEEQMDLIEAKDELLPDVIYIDPMFPTRTKSAQVKKEMQFFHDIVGSDEDSESLLLKSMNIAKKRIVVKRPRLAEKLTDKILPAFEITGKSTRYDIYLPIIDRI